MSQIPQTNIAYGVVYTPQTVQKPAIDVAEVLRLKNSGVIKYVRVQWVDLTNTVRFRILPISYFLKLCTDTARPGVCLTYATLGIIGIHLNPLFVGTGEYIYVIDLSSFRFCTYAPGHAVVMGFFQEKLPSPSGNLTVDLCPRTILKGIVE